MLFPTKIDINLKYYCIILMYINQIRQSKGTIQSSLKYYSLENMRFNKTKNVFICFINNILIEHDLSLRFMLSI